MSRNGRHLESFVQAKGLPSQFNLLCVSHHWITVFFPPFVHLGDTRFAFLYPVHALHSYYLHKISIYSEIYKNKPPVDVVKQPALLAPLIDKVEVKVEPVVERNATVDQDIMRIERRRKATLFLDQMKKDRASGSRRN